MAWLLIVHFFFGVKEETEPKKKTQNVLSSGAAFEKYGI